MKIKNGELELFINFVENKPEYTRAESRMRRNLISILSEKYKTFKNDHLELLKQFAKINEKSEFILIPIDDKNSRYDIADEIGFENEYQQLANELVIIDQTESNKQMLLTIKECVLAYDPKLKGNDAAIRDICHDIVEEINYEDASLKGEN